MSRLSTGLANDVTTLADRVVTLDTGSNNLRAEIHANRLLQISTADAAYTLGLPYATGSGDIYEFLLTVAHTSGSIVISARHPGTSTNKFVGVIRSNHSSGNIVIHYASTTNDIITLNNTTTGGVGAGDHIKIQDVAAQTWRIVDAWITSSGAQATPFSG